MESIFKELGLRKLDEYEVVYYKLNEEGREAGMVSTHVDDFDVAGRKKFVEMLTKEISKVLDVSTVERDCFRFTGIDVEKVKGGIEDLKQSNEEELGQARFMEEGIKGLGEPGD